MKINRQVQYTNQNKNETFSMIAISRVMSCKAALSTLEFNGIALLIVIKDGLETASFCMYSAVARPYLAELESSPEQLDITSPWYKTNEQQNEFEDDNANNKRS